MAAVDLATITQVKEYMGITAATDDSLLTRLITAASTFIETIVSRQLHSATYTDQFNGKGVGRQLLRNYPVTAVSSVVVDGVTIPASPTPQSSGYRFDSFGVFLNDYTFTRGAGNVQITYTAGYVTIPDDLVQACCELVALKYKEKGHIDKTSDSIAGTTTAYLRKDVPPFVQTVLDNYSRRICL